MRSGTEPLPSVAPLPLPKLPSWIEQISPTGEAQPLSQIRIRFKEALIPVERIDTSEQQSLLNKFEILPPLAGQFRFLTPRMVGFQADKALPKATRVQVTLKAGLADLKNHRLAEDLAWTFNTQAIQLTNLPGKNSNQDGESESEPQPIDIKPKLEFTSNVELEIASVEEHLKFIPEGKPEQIAVKVALKPEETTPEEQNPEATFDPSSRHWIYTIEPRSRLEKATRYRLEFSPGLRPSYGNLASEMRFSSQVFTYAPLAFEKIEAYGKPDSGGAYGRFVQGSPQLKFNNGLVAESAIANITVKPASKKGIPLVKAYDEDNLVSLNPWALEPTTDYTITIDKNLKDKFGQTLEKPITLQYNTGDVAADIWAPSGLNIFPAGTNLQLNVSTVNLPSAQFQAAYRVVEPTDLVYTDSAYPSDSSNNLLPNSNQWSSFPARGKKNQSYDNAVLLRKKLNGATGMLAYGVKAKTNSYEQEGKELWREPEFYGFVQLTNLGVFAQWFPDSGLVKVNHLADGSAVKNAAIELYRSQLEAKVRSQPTPCAIAKTDATGTAKIEGEAWQQCLVNSDPPKLLVIAREGQDWAFTRTNEYSGAYEYGIDAGWDDGKPQSRGVIFSDRELYQPGETAWFTGTAYYLKKGSMTQDKNTAYQVTLINPDGKETKLETQTTNNFGTFSLKLTLDKNQALGYYSLHAKGERGAEIYGGFRVAEFKPPNFKVDLSLDKEFAFAKQEVTFNTASDYFFGSPVQGGKVNYYVTREQTYFTPKGWEKFSFGRQWFWPEERPEVPNDVLQSSQILDAQGQNSQAVLVAADLPYPMTYRVEAQVTDVSNLSVSNTQTFTALPSEKLIGLQGDFVANSGQVFPIQIIVTDANGQALSGERVRVELQTMKYSSVTQLEEGSRTSRNQIEYKTVAQQEIRSGNEPQTVSLTPPASGSYRIQANWVNSKTDITATDLQLWVTGNNEVNWGDRYRNNRLEIQLDKETYKVGETATALIQSPYPDAEVYFAVLHHHPLYSKIQKVRGGAPKIQFPVTPDMLPNAAVQAVLVRQGRSLNQVEAGSVSNLVRIGFAPFHINLDDKYLSVKVTPQSDKLLPAGQQTLNLELRGDRGTPKSGQFTVMVVNEAVLQLTGYRPPDLVKIVYADHEITTRLADNRPDVVLTSPTSPLEKGWGFGGGLSAGIASTQVRKNFQALAYYNGSVLADATGKAQLTFTLPDDLTTWRVMVVASDGEWHFGKGEATFITSKPLSTNPILPQFARLGDRFLGGVAVTNTTGQAGNLAITGTVTDSLQFAEASTLQTNAALGTQAYRFPMVAAKVGEGKVEFSTQLNAQASDAFEVPLEVKTLAITEQAIASGTTTNEVKIPLNVDKQVVPDVGGLDISLASTLLPAITAPAQQVFDDDAFPFLEPAASRLSIAASLQRLSQQSGQAITPFKEECDPSISASPCPRVSASGISSDLKANGFNLPQTVTRALEILQSLQQPDGGFAAIPGSKTADPLITPYAATSLAQANAAGFAIEPALLSRLRGYLNKLLANPGQYDFCNTTACKNQIRLESLIALSELGDTRSDFLNDLYEQHQEFDAVNQIKLARYLSRFPEWQTEAQRLANQIQETIYETGRSATVNLPQSWRWFNSPTTAQAEALRLAIAQNARPETLDRLLQGLLNLRRNGIWNNSYDNAQALTALVAYSQLQPTPPNFSAIAQLDGKRLGQAQFSSNRPSAVELNVPMPALPRGRHDLILKKVGRGTLHYLSAYRYRLQGKQPGRLNGLRVSRYIRPANQVNILYKQGLHAPDSPLSVAAGQVFDVELEIITDHPIDRLAIADPLPAGFEAVDTAFQTASTSFQAQQDSWQIGYQQIYRDHVLAYGDRLDAGVYRLHYLVRSVTPGTFDWPGAEVHLQYAPEEFGRCASSTLEVKLTDNTQETD
jgi:uncharacterized protein YfaS (alpha-2-macroglobulin family)